MRYRNDDPMGEYAFERARTGNYGEDYEDDPVMYCENCDDPIYSGDIYYDFDGFVVCDGCLPEYLKEFRKTA